MFFSTARRATVRKIGRGRSSAARRVAAKEHPVDAAPPEHDVAEAARFQIAGEGRRRRHGRARCVVEAAEQRVDPGRMDRHPCGDIFGKAGMIARREREVVASAVAACEQAERPLRRDMDRVGPRRLDPGCDRGRRGERQSDLAIEGQRHRAIALRRQEGDVDAQGRQRSSQPFERAHDAVDLRAPRVGDDENAHGATVDALPAQAAEAFT